MHLEEKGGNIFRKKIPCELLNSFNKVGFCGIGNIMQMKGKMDLTKYQHIPESFLF